MYALRQQLSWKQLIVVSLLAVGSASMYLGWDIRVGVRVGYRF